MIVKILARHSPSYASLIKYILREGNGEVVRHNLRSDSVPGWTEEYLRNESQRKHERKGQVYVYHDILSLSANEDTNVVTSEVLRGIAQKYIELRGTEGIYLGAVHRRDRDHVHIHFCVSGTAFRTGNAMRLSRLGLQKLKSDLQDYHLRVYPELTHSVCEHGSHKRYYSPQEWYRGEKERRHHMKDALVKTAQACFGNATTQKDFLHLLRDAGLHHYERNGHAEGITTEGGMKFRFSRLGVAFDALRNDDKEEQRVLRHLRALREERDMDISRE